MPEGMSATGFLSGLKSPSIFNRNTSLYGGKTGIVYDPNDPLYRRPLPLQERIDSTRSLQVNNPLPHANIMPAAGGMSTRTPFMESLRTLKDVGTPQAGEPEIGMDAPQTLQSSTITKNPEIIGMDKPGTVQSAYTMTPPAAIKKDSPNDITTNFDPDEITDEDIEPDEFEYDTETGPLYTSALDVMAQGLTGEGTKGTQAAILGGREALATARRGAEAEAGGLAAATGAIGQGTAGSYAQQVRQQSLQSMAQQELGFAQLKSKEQQAMVDKIISAEQAEKGADVQAERVNLEARGQNITVEQLNRHFDHLDATLRENIASRLQQGEQFNLTRLDSIDQFNQTLQLTKDQWDDKFGLEKSQLYIGNLMEMSIDNPTLANKITKYMLTGQTGALGEFTAEEKTEMQTLADEARTKDARLDNIYDLVIANLEKELTGGTGVGTTEGGTEGGTGTPPEGGYTIQNTTYNNVPLSELNDIQWGELMDDTDALQDLYDKGVVQNIALTQDMVFRVDDAVNLGLKFDQASERTYYNRTGDLREPNTVTNKTLSAGEGNGSIIIQNGVPYRLVSYITTKSDKDFKDQRATEVIGYNLLTDTEEKLYEPEWYDI